MQLSAEVRGHVACRVALSSVGYAVLTRLDSCALGASPGVSGLVICSVRKLRNSYETIESRSVERVSPWTTFRWTGELRDSAQFISVRRRASSASRTSSIGNLLRAECGQYRRCRRTQTTTTMRSMQVCSTVCLPPARHAGGETCSSDVCIGSFCGCVVRDRARSRTRRDDRRSGSSRSNSVGALSRTGVCSLSSGAGDRSATAIPSKSRSVSFRAPRGASL